MIQAVAIENYRSLRRLVMPLRGVNVVTGANGSGKSSLYRALRLLADTSRNGAVSALAREGGLASTLWAGSEAGSSGTRRRGQPIQGTHRRARPIGLKLGFSSDEFGYAIDLGLGSMRDTAFLRDPEIKAESVWHGPHLRPATALTERQGPIVKIRSEDGSWRIIDHRLATYDSVMSELGAPEQAPEIMAVRTQLRSWRFYDQFRTDELAPARTSHHVGTRTPVLSPDGSDLPAALQTIVETGEEHKLAEVIDHAFPGCRLELTYPGSDPDIEDPSGRFSIALRQPGLLRPLTPAELSDGTLRYLLLVGALLSPRPPSLFVLNEPETSIHPELIAPLAALIDLAAATAQIVVVTHSTALAQCLDSDRSSTDVQHIELTKEDGETQIVGQEKTDEPTWFWPAR